MVVVFYFILYFSSFKIFAANPIGNRIRQDQQISPEEKLTTQVNSVINNFQLVALLVFSVILIFSVFIGLKQTILRMYFWKKKPYESLDDNSSKYKPVVCIHGLLDSASSLNFFADVIRENHPGTLVKVLDVYNCISSLQPMWKQIETIKELIEEICEEYPEGINLIGVSQGALLARGVLETSDKHNVDTYISVAGPHMGQFGIPMMHWLPGYKLLVKNMFRCAYLSCCQKLSAPEYWKDPNHLSLYEKSSKFLPILNNEINHPDSERFKSNFLRLRQLVLLGGPDDGFVSPWQSSHFGYYDEQGNIVEMKDQNIYINDSFGLRTLDEKKAVTVYSIPHTAHYFYVYDVPLIKKYILPHLD